MKKSEIISLLLANKKNHLPQKNFVAKTFAPSNIALIKYWGKRNTELNLPMTSSLSISLQNKGCEVELSQQNEKDEIFLNDHFVDLNSEFAIRLLEFVNLFRKPNSWFFTAKIISTVPIGAGLASSACGFAAVVKALDQLLDWQLSLKNLSILARLGSGSASRSLWDGFVEWHAGERDDGMDSFAEPLELSWPEFSLGLLILDARQKQISSRVAMQRTVETSILYRSWPTQVAMDLSVMRQAILDKNFELLGQTAEANALAMHATMLSARPAVNYFLPETIAAMQKIWQCRADGLPVYFTQDAGPNLKLLFLQKHFSDVKEIFPEMVLG